MAITGLGGLGFRQRQRVNHDAVRRMNETRLGFGVGRQLLIQLRLELDHGRSWFCALEIFPREIAPLYDGLVGEIQAEFNAVRQGFGPQWLGQMAEDAMVIAPGQAERHQSQKRPKRRLFPGIPVRGVHQLQSFPNCPNI